MVKDVEEINSNAGGYLFEFNILQVTFDNQMQ